MSTSPLKSPRRRVCRLTALGGFLLVGGVLAAGPALTGCSGGKQQTPSAGGSAQVGSTNDVNPKDVSALQQGGNLRLALTAFPENFNPLHIDGNAMDIRQPGVRPLDDT